MRQPIQGAKGQRSQENNDDGTIVHVITEKRRFRTQENTNIRYSDVKRPSSPNQRHEVNVPGHRQ